MKKICHSISLALVVILVFGSVVVIGAAAREDGPFTEFRLTTDDTVVENAQYGRSVAIDGDLVAIGMGGDGAIGAVYLYKRQGMKYVPEETLAFPDAYPATCPENDVGNCPEFGRTVAIQGNTVFVGARFAPVGSLKAGAVYVFRKQGDSWQFEDKIVSPAPEAEDNFGRALAIQGDLLVVTARKNDAERGASYVFEYDGDGWIHSDNLIASDAADGDYFGQSVDIQGDLIAIGARNAKPQGAGAVYLFRNISDVWTQVAKVIPSDGIKGDQYGFTVALSGDTMAVGSRRAGLTDTGAVYIYNVTGDSADLVTRIIPDDAHDNDEFGQSVAIAGDVIAVGAWKDDIESSSDQGSIYLFHRIGDQWIQSDKITASDGMAGDEFGYSLAAFGNRMVTGAHFADTRAGAAYVLSLRQLP